MKQLIFILILALGSTTARAQDTPSTNEGKTMQAAAKEHVCTEACKKAGHHVYAHGEKGHVCSEECMKMHADGGQRDHVCTDACKKAGHHVYAHGEKGHVCSEECMKMHEGMEKKGMEKKEKTETM